MTTSHPLTGVLRVLYFAGLFLFGILLGVHVHRAVQGPFSRSVALDAAVISALTVERVTDADTITNYRRERHSGPTSWIEYHRTVQVDHALNGRIRERLSAIARDRDLIFAATKTGGQEVLGLSEGRRLYYRLTLRPLLTGHPAGSAHQGPWICLVLDDAGDPRTLEPFLSLGIPVTVAVLPGQVHTRALARMLSTRKVPFLLHQPMEPERFPAVNPGPGALLLNMGPARRKGILEKNLSEVPGAAGVSNHMGSRFSVYDKGLREVFAVLKARRLVYFDSYTTPASRAVSDARAAGVAIYRNDLFLDNTDSPESIRRMLNTAADRAVRTGHCVVIGHVHKKYLARELFAFIPAARARGISFLPLLETAPVAPVTGP